MNNKNSNILLSWRLLYYTYGFIPIIAGFDKFFHALADWSIYLNEHIPLSLGFFTEMFMQLTGIIEIAAGLFLFLKPRLGGYMVCTWLIAIAINLITMGQHSHNGSISMVHYDIALRDIGLAVGAYALVLLSKELNK